MAKDANFTCDAADLRTAMKIAGWVVEKRTTLPPLEYARVEAFGSGINVTVTDLDCYLSFKVDCDGGTGAMALPVHAFSKVLSNGHTGPITMAFAGGEQVSGVNGGLRLKLPTMALGDLPEKQNDDGALAGFDINIDVFGWAVESCAPAISSEPTRYYLNGISLAYGKLDGKKASLYAAATDGHRLNICWLPEANGSVEKFGLIMPSKAADVLMRLILASDPEANLNVRLLPGGKLSLKGSFWHLITKTIDGTFPDISKVIPDKKSVKSKITADVEMTISAAKRMLALKPEKNALNLDAKGSTLSFGVSSGGSDGFEGLDATVEGKPASFGVNGTYVIDAASLCNEQLEIGIVDAGSPMRISDPAEDDFLQVLMPMRRGEQPKSEEKPKALPAPTKTAAEPKPEKAKAKPEKPAAKRAAPKQRVAA